MRPLVCLALTAVAVATVPASAQAIAPAGTAAALDTKLDRIDSAPQGPPGVSVLIQRGEKIEYRRRGAADVATGTRPKPRQYVRIASVSKAFSGAVALNLVSAGRLSLDDTIGERLPGLLPLANDVTLRQALVHTGGLPDYIRDETFIEALHKDPTGYLSPRELVGYVRDTPLRFRPGSRYEYSDTDNLVVALMAEAATGVPYERLLGRRVLSPLGLDLTSLPRTVRMPAPFMRGYEVAPGMPPENVSRVINPALAWASGGIVSTAVDTNRFFRSYVGGDLFGRAERRAQRRFRPGASSPPGPGRNSAGLGLFRYRTSCGTVYGHTGSFPGYRLFAASSADGRRSVAFFVNAQIVPGQGSRAVSNLIRSAQAAAICHAVR
ncbi:MAG TPA: serine hydrolase domain-containing protein [Thermoleophilaceae bacterium]|nr:serine hydrolase domain-containing protein [Thermoleophilaceae bacterium]